jgi:hypothetical protein
MYPQIVVSVLDEDNAFTVAAKVLRQLKRRRVSASMRELFVEELGQVKVVEDAYKVMAAWVSLIDKTEETRKNTTRA